MHRQKINLSEGQTLEFESVGILIHCDVWWNRVTSEHFIEHILPQWEHLQLDVPKRLLFVPFLFIFQISDKEIIYFSMFDKDDLFIDVELSDILVLPYDQYFIDPKTIECIEKEYPLTKHPLPPNVPQKILPKIVLPLSDILEVAPLNTEKSEPIPDTAADSQDQHIIVLTPSNLLKWYKLLSFETQFIGISGSCCFIDVDSHQNYWSEIRKRHGDYAYTLCCELRDYPRKEVEVFLYELMTMSNLSFD